MDYSADMASRTEDNDDVSRIAEELERLRARLEELENQTPDDPDMHSLAEQPDVSRITDALLSLIEAHPVRSAAIAFLLGALLFRGRR